AWLERGTASVRFTKPIHEGEEVLVAGAVTARDPKNLTATVTASTAAGGECATLTATLPAGSPVPLNLAQYRAGPLPPDRAGAPPGPLPSLHPPAPAPGASTPSARQSTRTTTSAPPRSSTGSATGLPSIAARAAGCTRRSSSTSRTRPSR